MDKLSDIINLESFKNQKVQENQSLISRPIESKNNKLPTLRTSDKPILRDCLASQLQLTDLLSQMCQGQKKYGESAENMQSKVKFFQLMLGDYDLDQIQAAFVQYAKTKDDIPAPANIIQLIENPPVASYDDVVCTCGRHYGQATHTPEKRAQSYAWHRRTGVNYTGDKKGWLESYEREHGEIA